MSETTTKTARSIEAPPSADGSETSTRNILLVYVGLMVAMLLSALDQTIFSTALPTIVGELHGVNAMLWVITVYILASTIMLPIYGKLGDLIGRKGIFIAAIAVFVLGSIIGGSAGDMTWLIIGRAVQGLGGGGLMVLAQAIIADVVSARDRGKYMGIMGGVFALSSVAGPLLGGWFTDGIGWRWGLWMNIPLGILAIASAVFFLHLPKTAKRTTSFDVAGMGLLALASTGLVLVSTWGGSTYDWDSPLILSLIAGTVITGIAFVLVERTATEPIIPLHLFKKLNFTLTTVAGLIIGVAMFGALAYLPTYLQMVTGANATQSGFLMIPMMATMLVSSVVSGWLVSKYGRYKWAPVSGTAIVAVGLFLLSTMSATMPVWAICAYVAVLGLGLGLCMQMLVLIVQNTFPLAEVGTVTASNNYFRQIGASLGSAVVGSLFTVRLTSLMTERMPSGAAGLSTNALTPDVVKHLPAAVRSIIVGAYNDALTPVFIYIVPLVLIALILLCFLKEEPLRTTIDREPAPESLATSGVSLVRGPADDAASDRFERERRAR